MHIEPQHFAYLKIQRGRINDLARDFDKWKAAYEADLLQDLEDIKPYLPVKSVLDIGSGLGGIDALIHAACGAEIALLDGVNDPPKMERHAATFSNAMVAVNFLRKNGVKGPILTLNPRDMTWMPAKPQDLVISLGSWCFHYQPEVYLDLVRRCTIPGSVIIVDVRRERAPDWGNTLAQAFKAKPRLLRKLRKADRCAFVRGSG